MACRVGPAVRRRRRDRDRPCGARSYRAPHCDRRLRSQLPAPGAPLGGQQLRRSRRAARPGAGGRTALAGLRADGCPGDRGLRHRRALRDDCVGRHRVLVPAPRACGVVPACRRMGRDLPDSDRARRRRAHDRRADRAVSPQRAHGRGRLARHADRGAGAPRRRRRAAAHGRGERHRSTGRGNDRPRARHGCGHVGPRTRGRRRRQGCGDIRGARRAREPGRAAARPGRRRNGLGRRSLHGSLDRHDRRPAGDPEGRRRVPPAELRASAGAPRPPARRDRGARHRHPAGVPRPASGLRRRKSRRRM